MGKEHDCCYLTSTSIDIFLLMVVTRVVYVIYWTGKPLSSKYSKPWCTFIVVGSVSGMRKDRFTPRFYIAAATDNMSLQKSRVLEDLLAEWDMEKEHYWCYLTATTIDILLFSWNFSQTMVPTT